jgi:CheY-like chemotaxis protein
MQLLEYVRTRHPVVPVIIMSGYATEAVTERVLERGARAVLAKPFRRSEFLRVLREKCGIGVKPD